MVLKQSSMMPLGTPAPDFALPDSVSGDLQSLQTVCGEKGTLVAFICNHCPFVIHVAPALAALANAYAAKGIAAVAISSNDVDAFPQDGPQEMARFAQEQGFGFPYLYDETQQVARAYDAQCTPDFFLFNAQLKLVYRGQMDDSRPGNGEPNDAADLAAAMDSVLGGTQVSQQQYPSSGCNIKWKSA